MLPIVAERRDMVVQHEAAPKKVKADPSPSKLNYRLERLWLTRWFRDLVKIWLPLFVLIVAGYTAYTSPTFSAWASKQYQDVRTMVAARPELKIERISIPVGSPDLQRQILGVVDLSLPVSAIDVDLAEMRDLVLGLNAVKAASVRFKAEGVLEVAIVERMPSMVWRDQNRIYLLDESGVLVAEVPRRSVRSDLPLVVGMGAERAVLEAREIFSVLAPVEGQVLGLVRMGERRWDVVFENVAVMLPAEGAADAMRSVMQMQARDDILERDVSIIDLRDPSRPVLRLNDEALSELRRLRVRVSGERV